LGRVDAQAQVGHDYTQVGCATSFPPLCRQKPRRRAVYEDAAACPPRALWPASAKFYASELIRSAGTGSGAAQRELARLEHSGLIVARRIGNQKHYQANAASPLFGELRNIVLKTVGLAEPLRDALKRVASEIRAAFIYGSVAKAADQAGSDIDLMVVSDTLSYGDVFGALDKLSRTLGRNVNPTVYSAAEFSKRAKNENAFITRVLEGPKVWVIGSQNDLPLNA
jgi:predicted nucleotidyltransferase